MADLGKLPISADGRDESLPLGKPVQWGDVSPITVSEHETEAFSDASLSMDPLVTQNLSGIEATSLRKMIRKLRILIHRERMQSSSRQRVLIGQMKALRDRVTEDDRVFKQLGITEKLRQGLLQQNIEMQRAALRFGPGQEKYKQVLRVQAQATRALHFETLAVTHRHTLNAEIKRLREAENENQSDGPLERRLTRLDLDVSNREQISTFSIDSASEQSTRESINGDSHSQSQSVSNSRRPSVDKTQVAPQRQLFEDQRRRWNRVQKAKSRLRQYSTMSAFPSSSGQRRDDRLPRSNTIEELTTSKTTDELDDSRLSLPSAEEKQMKHEEALVRNELESLEDVYAKNWQLCLTHYVRPLMDKSTELGISASRLNTMFSNVEAVANYHQLFVEDISQSLDVGQAFLSNSRFFTMYEQYFTDYAHSMSMLKLLQLENKKLVDFLQRTQRTAPVKGMSLEQFFKMPFEQIPQYEKKLTRLGGCLSEEYLKSLHQALVIVKKAAGFTVQAKARFSLVSSVLNTSARAFRLVVSMLRPGRNLLRFGELIREHQNRRKKYFYVLFTDCVIEASAKNYKTKSSLELKNCMVAKYDESVESFQIMDTSTHNSSTLIAKDSITRDCWFDLIADRIQVYRSEADQGWQAHSKRTLVKEP